MDGKPDSHYCRSRRARYLPELAARGEPEEAKNLTAFLFRPLALSSCVALAAFALYAGWVWAMPSASEWRAQPVTWLGVGAFCAMQMLGSFAMGYLRGMQRFDCAASIAVISVLIQLTGIAGTFALIMPAALPLVYGQAFSDAVPAAIILVTAFSFAAVSSVGSSLVFGADRSDIAFLAGWIGAALSIFAVLTVITLFGVLGASWSRARIQMGLAAFGIWFILRRLRCRDLARLLVPAALCALSARASILLIPGLLAIQIAVLAGINVYVVAVRILAPLLSKDVSRLRSLCRKFLGVLGISLASGFHLIFGGERSECDLTTTDALLRVLE
jgi:O-antigen/teichoic acid export membrane protein